MPRTAEAVIAALTEAYPDLPPALQAAARHIIDHPREVGVESMIVAPYNDAEAVERIVKDRKDELAAIIVEPVQRIIPAAPEFLQALRRICDEQGVLLIFDEVVTGFRLAYGGAQVHYGITPDLASFGKVIGAGGPLSCVAGRAEILDLCDPRRKGEPDYVYFNGTLHEPVGELLDPFVTREATFLLSIALTSICHRGNANGDQGE